MFQCVLDSSGSRQHPVAGSGERGSEPSDCIQGEECSEQLSDCWLLKELITVPTWQITRDHTPLSSGKFYAMLDNADLPTIVIAY
jgi:hypothetical protein